MGFLWVYNDISLSRLRIEERIIGDAKLMSGMLSFNLEQEFREGDSASITSVISMTAASPHIRAAVLYDDNNIILSSTRYQLKGSHLKDSPYLTLQPVFGAVRDSQSGIVRLSEDKKSLFSLYPVPMGTYPSEIRPSRKGILLLDYDLSYLKSAATHEAWQRSHKAGLILMAFTVAMWYLLNKAVTWRIARLVNAADLMACGNLDARVDMRGNDELARLSSSFNHMADKIQADIDLIKKNDAVLQTIIEATPDTIIIKDEGGRWLFINRSAASLFELEGIDYKGKTDAEVGDIVPFYKNVFDYCIESDEKAWQAKGLSRSNEAIPQRNGSALIFDVLKIPLFNDDGERWQMVVVGRDITAQRQEGEKIEYYAYHDPLTGLLNRTLFHDLLGVALSHADRNGETAAVMFIDIDNFKTINDTLGHKVGDMVLQTIADRLKKSVRMEDSIARYGGDEFILILPNIEEDDASTVAKKMIDALLKPIKVNSTHNLQVTLSIGISLYPADGSEADELIKNADSAMYQAKKIGKNRYCKFTPDQVKDHSRL